MAAESIVTRISLKPTEWARVKRHSRETGIPLARLVADAVRAQLLTVKDPA